MGCLIKKITRLRRNRVRKWSNSSNQAGCTYFTYLSARNAGFAVPPIGTWTLFEKNTDQCMTSKRRLARWLNLLLFPLALLSALPAIGKAAKETVAPYCPEGSVLLDTKSPKAAGIRKTAMAFAKLDFDGVRGSPNEGKYYSLIPASALRKNRSVFPGHLDSAVIRGYRWSHACSGEEGATAWIKIDLAYLTISSPRKIWPDVARSSQRYYDSERGSMVDAIEGGTLLHRYPRKNDEYSDYIAPPRRYYLLPLLLLVIEDRWLVNDPQQVREHFRIRTPNEERRIKAMTEKHYAVDPSELYRWSEHDEAILQMIVRLTKPAFKN